MEPAVVTAVAGTGVEVEAQADPAAVDTERPGSASTPVAASTVAASTVADAGTVEATRDALDRLGPRALRTGRKVGSAVISIAVVLGAWQLFLEVFHVSSFVGRGPLDVWRYVVTSSGSAAVRSTLASQSLVTLRDVSLGLVAGTAAALGCAFAVTLWRAAAQVVMPVAMLLRSMPLVAMTPLIVGMFGRNLRAITVIAGIVTFFPTFVNVGTAMRSANRVALEVCHAYGASVGQTIRKVQFPSAVPAFFASLRIAAPLALVGALLAEWLATGSGLGYAMLTAGAESDYDGMWARVALVTIYSMLLYLGVGVIERHAAHRFSTGA